MKVPPCLLCRRLSSDGFVFASQELDDTDRICYFCIWRAQRDSYRRQDIFFTMAWWPTTLEMDASAKVLRKYFMEEKIEQSWVKLKLEYIDVPKYELNVGADAEMEEKEIPVHSSRKKNVPLVHPRFGLEAKLQPRQRRAKGQCLECPYSTKYASHLRMHVARIHMPLTLRCDLCTSMFAIPQTLNQHKRNVHTFKKCSLCEHDVTNGGFGEHKKLRKCRKCKAEFACAGLHRNHNTLRPSPPSISSGKAALDLPLPSPPSCQHPGCVSHWLEKINGKEVKAPTKPTKTFLQAYPAGRLCDEELQSLLPLDWSPTCVHDFRRFGLVRVPLPPGYECVVHSLNMQLGGERVRAIEKVENPYQFLLYQLKMMESKGGLERVLFHGTSYANILSITRDNLNWRLAGSRVGHRHGLGVYFSTSAFFCLRFARPSRCFLVARVPVSAISRGSSDTRLPGPSADATGDGRHTVVKYHDHEFYPQFVVHF
ncbi:Hypothetical predicted protein [Cloeon dipterum]|uniref:C2H2-type domain-containing protein n=1 Tax=Cloeon dipterum TaxID=197152 RepID=A0A8S1D7T1_9INSE|nr:Hypothetical predicted protein [Cloeon dipterum]